MTRLGQRNRLRAAVLAATIIGCGIAQVGWTGETQKSTDESTVAVSQDPNVLRWDLAEGFGVVWDSVELSATVRKGYTPNVGVCTLTIDMRVDILNSDGLITIDVNRPEVSEVYDGDGRIVEHVHDPVLPVRRYEEAGWQWDSGLVYTLEKWHPGKLVLRLPIDPNHPVPASISRLVAFIHVIYGEVIEVDVPFDTRGGGWLSFNNVPDLLFRVDSSTPPPPGPLDRKQPLALYRYETWVKSESGQPVMGVRDLWPWYPRDLYPFGDYAVVRTELFDSQEGVAAVLPTPNGQFVQSCPAGVHREGAWCWGRAEQDSHAYDMIRHVLIGRPVEVKIPFVLKDIPVPSVQSASK